ncbi:MAG: hypothetical protein IIA60_07470 [Candidatus Marinimicrobia bacterium]|nr:hypothetical protein [Candidatus Neomarinimicrobiota bacterium]
MLPANRVHRLLIGLTLPLMLLSAWPIDRPVIIEQRATGLAVFNFTRADIYCAAFKTGTVALAGWRPCNHPDICPGNIARPGLAARLQYIDIYHWLPGVDVTTYWWHLIPDAAGQYGYRVTDLTEKIVATPLVPIFPDD